MHLFSLFFISRADGVGGFILPREILAAAGSKGAFFGTFFRSAGRKESTKKSGVAQQLWLLLTLTVCYSHTLWLQTLRREQQATPLR